MVARLSRPRILRCLTDDLGWEGKFYLHCAAVEELLMTEP